MASSIALKETQIDAQVQLTQFRGCPWVGLKSTVCKPRMCFCLCQIEQGSLRVSLRTVRQGEKNRRREKRGEEVKRRRGEGREGEILVKIFLVHKTNSVHLGFGELGNILCTAPK